LIPKITQKTLAEMIGTSSSRVSSFMNRFRKLGFIEYNGRVRGSQIAAQFNLILHDQLPEQNAVSAGLRRVKQGAARRKGAVVVKIEQHKR
jgi:hypothetical protein